MKSNVFIIHGTEGYPEENWFPWLKGKLEEKGHKVFVPQFPTPPVVPAKISEWFEVLKNYEQYINEDTIFIGHSLGGVFTLRILEKLNHPVKASILTGTPIGVRPILNYDRDSSFSGFDFDWQKINNNCKNFVVFHSDNDPYVSLGNGEELEKHLGVELTFIPNAGHFNAKAGYLKFEALLEKLEPLLSS
jgi:predicted alpha/beta hydrolase family esterase